MLNEKRRHRDLHFDARPVRSAGYEGPVADVIRKAWVAKWRCRSERTEHGAVAQHLEMLNLRIRNIWEDPKTVCL